MTPHHLLSAEAFGAQIEAARDTEDEHRTLMLAALDRDEERSADLLINHIRSVAVRIRSALDNAELSA